MKKVGLWISVLTLLAAAAGMALGQSTPLSFTCVVGRTASPPTCPDDSSTPLTRYNSPPGPAHVSVAGYFSPNDGGAGEFFRLGSTGGSTPLCVSDTYAAKGSAGSTTMTNVSMTLPYTLANLVVGELVTGIGTDGSGDVVQVQPGTEIASIDTVSGKIGLTLPLTGTGTNANIGGNLTGANGGTLIIDLGGDCYQKTNYRGDPHEFGAYGDASTNGQTGHDDTARIQNWLGAYGNVSNLAPGAAPSNFGPWNATVPANYLISSPLFCPPNATIRGDENQTNNGNGSNTNPRINFVAAAAPNFTGLSVQLPLSGSNYYGSQAVLGLNAFCRVSGIAVTGNNFHAQTVSSINTGPTTTLTIASGDTNLASVAVGNAVYATDVANGNILTSDGTVVVGIAGSTCGTTCTVTVSQPVAADSGHGADVTFFGPDAVDVLGNANTVTIDGFTALQNGRYDLFCGIPLANESVTALRVQNTHLQSAMQHGMYIPGSCDNTRLMDNNVSQAGTAAAKSASSYGLPVVGGDGIWYGGFEASIEGGIVQDSAGAGIRLAGAHQMSVTGIAIIGNGSQDGGGDASAGIAIDQSHDITICNNHFAGNGGIDADSAQIYFNGSTDPVDDVNLCGDVYVTKTPGNRSANADIAPLYVYDADPQSTLTNIHIYETAAQPAISVFSPNAQPLLQAALTPQFTNNQIGGFTLQNAGTIPSQQITVQPGSAADSTNSTLIQLTSPCTVNLGSSGPGGLDSGGVAALTTYYIYVIAAASGGSVVSPSCMASTSAARPDFSGTAFANSGYQSSFVGGTLGGGTTVYNIGHPVDLKAGDPIWASGVLSSGTVVSRFSANSQPSSQLSGTWTGAGSSMDTTITLCSSCTTTGIQAGMAVQDASECIPTSARVHNVYSTTIAVTNIPTTCSSGMIPVKLGISGAQQLELVPAATTTTHATGFTAAVGYYRLVGALYTDVSSDFVQFTQDGDTYYLATPVADVSGVSLTNTPTNLTLASVPDGIKVKAFGRCVGGTGTTTTHHVIVYSPDQATAPVPQAFPGAPGFDVSSLTPSTAFPFSAWTDTSRTLLALADTGTSPVTTIDCVTDGWVWHRGQ